MKPLHFYKYSANGNNFVMLDESQQAPFEISQKVALAKMLCHNATGIGCDTLIFIQPYQPHLLPPTVAQPASTPDYIMRIFEQNGFESDCCGNGLICLGLHLATIHNRSQAIIATEIPSGQPRLRQVSKNGNAFCVDMGEAALPTQRLINLSNTTHQIIHDKVYQLEAVGAIKQCYFTYTGAPHVIIFVDQAPATLNPLFTSSTIEDPLASSASMRLNQIGYEFNQLATLFPLGTNVSVVKILDKHRIAYRCYERGVYDETYACGTGATAVAAVADALNIWNAQEEEITILPWHARSNPHYQQAEIRIRRKEKHYSLISRAHRLAEGTFYPLND